MNHHKTRRFANFGAFLTGRKSFPPPPSIVEKTRSHAGATLGLDAGASYGFGAGENDWLGAEAYVTSLF